MLVAPFTSMPKVCEYIIRDKVNPNGKQEGVSNPKTHAQVASEGEGTTEGTMGPC